MPIPAYLSFLYYLPYWFDPQIIQYISFLILSRFVFVFFILLSNLISMAFTGDVTDLSKVMLPVGLEAIHLYYTFGS